VAGRDEASLRPWPEAPSLGVAVALTTCHGGVSDGPYRGLNLGLHVGDAPDRVITNRTRAARAFGVMLDALVFAEQVHGTDIAVVGPDDRGRGTRSMDDALRATDILVTATPGTVLAILVADCVPVALVDPEARVLAAVHAGWRGTAAGAVPRALAAMCRLGATPERVRVFMGPAVNPDRYQVDAPVLDGLTGSVAPDPLHRDVARSDGPDHWLVDLVAANRQQLTRAGVRPDHLFDSGTTTDDADFFSDRRARPCGRFALLARLLPA
jgi:YfiH family protein